MSTGYSIVAINNDDPEEFYSFRDFSTHEEAHEYLKEKEQALKDAGGWTLEIRIKKQ